MIADAIIIVSVVVTIIDIISVMTTVIIDVAVVRMLAASWSNTILQVPVLVAL
tara:strand:- start:571 stop:729 length:159 start_codon:yes stop_codon:yes gene_type:complete